ncbi:MAG: hypothetical protein JO180_06365 [Gemmatirosa sp.]|nr:hypothetical protein [Gemmatirosa sp.]
MPNAVASDDGAPATLAFLADWQEQQQGEITAGGSVVVHYEPERLTNGSAPGEIVGYARFLPGGQFRHARLVARAVRARKASAARAAAASPLGAEIAVPPETRHMELWFQGVDAEGATRWDSRFGANYRFDVVMPAPAEEDHVQPRPDAVVDAEVVRVADDAAVKENAAASRSGYPSGRLDLRTTLRVAARVSPARTLPARASAARKKAAAASARVWIDVHAFEGAAARVQAETLALAHAGPTDDGAERFALDELLYQGSVASPGSVTPRADVRTVHYRLYAEIGGKTYTDGVVHRCYLATDPVSG